MQKRWFVLVTMMLVVGMAAGCADKKAEKPSECGAPTKECGAKAAADEAQPATISAERRTIEGAEEPKAEEPKAEGEEAKAEGEKVEEGKVEGEEAKAEGEKVEEGKVEGEEAKAEGEKAGTEEPATAEPKADEGEGTEEPKEGDVDEKTVTTPSGLKYVEIKEGDGANPSPGQLVIVHYTGWLLDGTKFDSSVDRGDPFRFPIGMGRVIRGWDEGVMTMKIGGKRKLIIPAELGYGARGAGNVIPPNSTLVFEVELLGVQ
jgi:peptidylprolyl isomerase